MKHLRIWYKITQKHKNTKLWPPDSLWTHSSQAKTVLHPEGNTEYGRAYTSIFLSFFSYLNLDWYLYDLFGFAFLPHTHGHPSASWESISWAGSLDLNDNLFLLMHLTTLNFSTPRTQLLVRDHQNRHHTEKKGPNVWIDSSQFLFCSLSTMCVGLGRNLSIYFRYGSNI